MIGSFNVSPRNVRRTVVRAIGSASGDGRHDGEVVAVHELGLQSRPEANILIVPVDVDELAELTLVIVKALLETREFLIQLVQRLRDVGGIDLDNGRAAGQLPQGAGDANLDRHYVVVIISSARSVPSPACGGGQGGGRCYGRRSGGAYHLVSLAPLGDEVVDGADHNDHDDGRLEDRDVADGSQVGNVRQGSQIRIAGRPRPQEVDQHASPPDQAKDIDDHAPAAELEGGALGRPPLGARDQDRDVAEKVGEVDHPGRGDRNDASAGVIEERDRRESTDDDARPDRGVQGWTYPVVEPGERELPVAGHSKGQPNRRGLDRQAADVDGQEYHQQVQVRRPTRQVRLDDAHRRRNFGTRRISDVLVHIARDGNNCGVKEDRADDKGADDGGQDCPGGRLPRVLRLFGESTRRVESIDDEERHEHRRQEGTRLGSKTRTERSGVEDDPGGLVVGEDQEHQREDHHAKDLKNHAGVVHESHQPYAVDVEDGRADQHQGRDGDLGLCVVWDVQAKVVEQWDQHNGDGYVDRRNSEDAGKQVHPSSDPRVAPVRKVLRPLVHRAGDREVRAHLGKVEGDDELTERDDWPTPKEEGTPRAKAERVQREDPSTR